MVWLYCIGLVLLLTMPVIIPIGIDVLINKSINKKYHIVDAMEVVRCKDCKYDENCMTQSFVRENGDGVPFTKDFFCADGERKDDAG